MGHHITAIIAKHPIKDEAAKRYDLPVIFLPQDLVMVGLEASHTDHWTEKLGFEYGNNGDIILDCSVTHHFAHEMGISLFSLIHTDYFGGMGTQFAVVYDHGRPIMETKEGGINEALRHLGVWCVGDQDEFDSIGLGNHRNFERYFDQYEF